jgi:ABC-type dipeptide/oligopeptide/nickel transport system permease component
MARGVTPYLARRLWWAAVTLVGISVINFLLIYAVPVDPARMIVGIHAPEATVLAVRRALGLDRPVYVQYGLFIWNLVHLNLGYSYLQNRPVTGLIAQAFGNTARLAIAAFVAEIVIGGTLGYVSAFQRGRWLDRALSLIGLVGMSIPNYWLGTMFLFLFAFAIPIFPLYGQGNLNLVLPALTIGLTGAAYYMRVLRISLVEIMTADHVRTARAKGLDAWRVNVRHILRNALIPVVTLAGMDIAGMLSGIVIIETVFGWPGVGELAYQAVQNLDIPVVMGTVLYTTAVIVLLNLAVDILYAFLDPRVRYG